MKIIDYYIIRKFLGTFFYAIFLLIFVVIIFDVSENIDEFLKNKAPLKEIVVDYYLNFIPYFINLFIYLFTFIAVVFFTSKMASNTEIIAILNGGMSFYRLLRPYLMSATVLALLSFYLTNFLIPVTNETRREFRGKYIKKLEDNKERNLHLQIKPGIFIYVEKYNISSQYGTRFTIEKFKENKLYYKLIAEKIYWKEETKSWQIKKFYERKFDNGIETFRQGDKLDTTFSLQPVDLYTLKEDYEIMNYHELNDKIEYERLKGSKNLKYYEVEKGKRLASPFATLVMTLIGFSLSNRKIRGGIGMHLGLGLGIAFSFILFMQVSTVFAISGNLPPLFAAWVPIILFSIIAFVLMRSSPK
jgi:lipopolysaccharide export system permease protein